MKINFKKTVMLGLVSLVAVTGIANAGIPVKNFSYLSLSDTSTPSYLFPFYCTAKCLRVDGDCDENTVVHMRNHAQMITGFNERGYLVTTVKELNSHYFNSYHDPKKSGRGWVMVLVGHVVGQGDYWLHCVRGETGGRALMTGPYGR